jgi:hypothetical protein
MIKSTKYVFAFSFKYGHDFTGQGSRHVDSIAIGVVTALAASQSPTCLSRCTVKSKSGVVAFSTGANLTEHDGQQCVCKLGGTSCDITLSQIFNQSFLVRK